MCHCFNPVAISNMLMLLADFYQFNLLLVISITVIISITIGHANAPRRTTNATKW